MIDSTPGFDLPLCAINKCGRPCGRTVPQPPKHVYRLNGKQIRWLIWTEMFPTPQNRPSPNPAGPEWRGGAEPFPLRTHTLPLPRSSAGGCGTQNSYRTGVAIALATGRSQPLDRSIGVYKSMKAKLSVAGCWGMNYLACKSTRSDQLCGWKMMR